VRTEKKIITIAAHHNCIRPRDTTIELTYESVIGLSALHY